MSVKVGLRFCSKIVACGLLLGSLLPVSVQAQTVSWKQQLGTSSNDGASSIATDSNGNVYTTGTTYGSLAGANQGSNDVWLAKYDSSGTLLWKQQLGTFEYEDSNSITSDASGNVYVAGGTLGPLAGVNNFGWDAWVAKYNTNGKLVWKQQLGNLSFVYCSSVVVDINGNVYISGSAEDDIAKPSQGGLDAWVAKYNNNGALVWKRQMGTSDDEVASGLAIDSNGNIYITGSTDGSLAGTHQGNYDAWIAKFDSNGTPRWKRQLGTSSIDYASGVATDRFGNVYISGRTTGALAGTNNAGYDTWVAKYNNSGALLWKQQLGLFGPSVESSGIATDSNGNVYISGYTTGSLAAAIRGKYDAWVAKYNTTGTLVWKQQLGTIGTERSSGVATDSIGNVYISGTTDKALGGPYQGGFSDAFIVKYTQ